MFSYTLFIFLQAEYLDIYEPKMFFTFFAKMKKPRLIPIKSFSTAHAYKSYIFCTRSFELDVLNQGYLNHWR
jgi:hypothetical protein